VGVAEKLSGYSLNPDHPEGGAKAHAFRNMLGITLEDIEHLEAEIREGIQRVATSSVSSSAFGVRCVVDLPIAGIRVHRARVMRLRTVWQFADSLAPPRLLTAFLKP
jgi:uncharacterized protein DUF6883